MKRKTKAKVILQKKLQEGIYDLRLGTDLAQDAHAGQFIGIYTSDRSKLLPRPISICEYDADGRMLRLVYRVTGPGTGTEQLSQLTPGDDVNIIGILGNGYDTAMIAAEYKHPVIMGGGIGIPPMLGLVKELDEAYQRRADELAATSPDEAEALRDVRITSILGYRDSNLFLANYFTDASKVFIATEDGSTGTPGNVLDVMRNGRQSDAAGVIDVNLSSCDVILACGPMPMLRAITAYARENGIKAYVSLEERMACGIGACLGCIAKTRDVDSHSHVHNARICTDGPVFDADLLDI